MEGMGREGIAGGELAGGFGGIGGASGCQTMLPALRPGTSLPPGISGMGMGAAPVGVAGPAGIIGGGVRPENRASSQAWFCASLAAPAKSPWLRMRRMAISCMRSGSFMLRPTCRGAAFKE